MNNDNTTFLSKIRNKLNEKNTNFETSYHGLRKGIGILGMALPFMLTLGNMILPHSLPLQPTISDYYYTPMRGVFVGVLWAIGTFLFSYKGYQKKDDWLGDFAAVCAICVALFPTAPCCPSANEAIIGKVHLGSAALLFSAFAGFCLGLFTKGEDEPSPEKHARNRIYIACGICIILCIALIMVVFFFGLQDKVFVPQPVFWLESLAIEAFGISWLVKGDAIAWLNDDTPPKDNDSKVDTPPEQQSQKTEQRFGLPIIVCIGVLLIGILPWALPIINEHLGWGLDKKNELGDALGGMTAPFLSLLNAVLVYLAFQKQIEANEAQKEAILGEQKRFNDQHDFETLVQLFERCELKIRYLQLHNMNYSRKVFGAFFIREHLLDFLANELEKKNDMLPENLQKELNVIDNNGRNAFQARRADTLSMVYNSSGLFQKKNLVSYFDRSDRWFIHSYKEALEMVYFWAKRLDRSTLHYDDKSYLVQAYMSDLFDDTFRLDGKGGKNIWIRVLISHKDEIFG